MVEIIVISFVAFIASGLTFFSGFGLGTILLPVFAIFFPLDVSLTLTAIVHLLNNLFKLILVGKFADKKVVFNFGLPAILGAFFGSMLFFSFASLGSFYTYELFGRYFSVNFLEMLIGILIIIFSYLELKNSFNKFQFNKKYLPVGGIISGFFGGLSGHQGAFRSAFLIKLGLTKEAFIASGVVIACIIDFTRISVYLNSFSEGSISSFEVLISATFSAFLGAFIGNKFVKKVTIENLQKFIAVFLIVIGFGLATGII